MNRFESTFASLLLAVNNQRVDLKVCAALLVGLCSLVCANICSAQPSSAPAHVWFSLSSTQPLAGYGDLNQPLEIDLKPGQDPQSGESRTLYLWAQPGVNAAGNLRTLMNVSLDVLADRGRIDFRNPPATAQPPLPEKRVKLFNPVLPVGPGGSTERFEFVRDADYRPEGNESVWLNSLQPNEIDGSFPDELFGLLAINPSTLDQMPGVGIGPVGGGCHPDDSTCNDTSFNQPAWLLGEIPIAALDIPDMAGDLTDFTAVHLQIGARGINHAPDTGGENGTTSATNVRFGPPGSDNPVYNAGGGSGGDRQHNFNPVTDCDGFICNANYDASPELIVRVLPELRGDYNDDGMVDAADYTVWRDTLGSTTDLRANGNGNTEVDQGDYLVWRRNFGRTSVPVGSSVPEPGGLIFLAIVLGLYLPRRDLLEKGFAVLLGVSFLLSCDALTAQEFNDHRWTEADNFNWNNLQNWERWNGSSWVIPTQNRFDEARKFFFNSAGQVRLNGDQVVRLISFSNSNGSFDVNTGVDPTRILGIRDLGLDVLSGTSQVRLNSTVRIQEPHSWRNHGANRLIVNGEVWLNSDLTVNGPSNTEINGVVGVGPSSGSSGRLIKRGNGVLTLAGINTFATGIDVLDGELQIDADANLGGGPLIIDGATWRVNQATAIDNPIAFLNSGGVPNSLRIGTNNVTFSGNVTGGQWAKHGNGTLTLSGTHSGFVGVEDGTVLLSNQNTLGGGADISGDATLWAAASDNWSTVSDYELHGSGKLLKSGTGRLSFHSLASTSSFSGEFEIEGGQLAGTPAQLNRPITTNRSTAEAVFLGDGEYSGTVSGPGKLVKEAGGTLLLSGSNDYTGATMITGGILALGNNSRISDVSDVVVSSGATFNVNSFAESIDGLSGSGFVTLGNSSGRLNVGVNNGSSTFSGLISGTGRLEKRGSGTLALTGANTYSGQTTVSAGRLELGASQSSLVYSVSGSLALQVSDAISDQAHLALGPAATFAMNDRAETVGSLEGSAGARVVITNGSLTVGDNDLSTTYNGEIIGVGGQLIKRGNGNMTVSGVNTYSGPTFIEAGTLTLGNNSRISDLSDVTVSSGATFNVNSFAESIDGLSGSGSVTLGNSSGRLNVGQNNGNSTFSGVISGVGRLEKRGTGTLTLSGANTYSGPTIITAGTLAFNANSPLSDLTDVTVSAGAVLSMGNYADAIDGLNGSGQIAFNNAPTSARLIVGANNGSSTFSGTIVGGGRIDKRGTGTITLSGVSTYSGLTNIEAGTLNVNGSIAGDASIATGAILGGSGTIGGNVTGPGRVAPGNSPGILTIEGDYTQSSTSVLDIEIEGVTTAGVDYDQVRVGGEVTLGGTYNFDVIGFTPTAGQSITFIDTFTAPGNVQDGEVLPTTAATRPKFFVPALEGTGVAARVVSTTGVGGNVRLDFVPRTDVFFDGLDDEANWFDAVDWSDDMVPDEADSTTVGGNVFVEVNVPQRVVVGGSPMLTAPVHDLLVGDGLQPVVVAIETGYELSSNASNIEVSTNGGIELAGGLLSVGSTRQVKVTETGALSGDGFISGALEVGMAASDNATLSPGDGGTAVGTINITGNYTQGTGGTFAVDLESEDPGGADFIDVQGDVALAGTLKVDVSNLDPLDIQAGKRFELIAAENGTGEFDQVELIDTGNLLDGYFLEPYYETTLAGSGSEGGSGGVEEDFGAGATIRVSGDVTEDGMVTEEDVQFFTATLFSPPESIVDITFNNKTLESTKAFSHFDSTDDGIIDFDDIPGLVQQMERFGGMSAAAATASIRLAMQRAMNRPNVPEPASLMLAIVVGWLSAGRRPSTRRVP